MHFIQSLLTCGGLCLVAGSILLTPSLAHARGKLPCQDSNCVACTSANDKFDVCPHAEACSCECTGTSGNLKCTE